MNHISLTSSFISCFDDMFPHHTYIITPQVHNDLHVVGCASVEESLMIGSGFALNKEGITVDVAQHTGMLYSEYSLCL